MFTARIVPAVPRSISLWWSHLFQPAIVQDDHLTGDLERLLLIVGDEQAGDVDLVVQPAEPGFLSTGLARADSVRPAPCTPGRSDPRHRTSGTDGPLLLRLHRSSQVVPAAITA
jgi:hypothetical protein